MSKRSQFKINQRVREGIEGRRRVNLYVLKREAEKIADLVGAKVKEMIVTEIANELDCRGYPQEAQACDQGSLSDRNPTASILNGVRENPQPPIKETPDREGCSGQKTGEGNE